MRNGVPIRVLLVDDHIVVREGFRSILADERDLEVVGVAGDGLTAVCLAERLTPDIVIMDVGMRDLNGIEATRRIAVSVPRTRVIGLSMHTERRFVTEMLRAGASGYLPKDCPSRELLQAIRAVAAGQTYISPAVTGDLVADFVARRPDAPPCDMALLTGREREVLQLIAEGRSIKDIAAHLSLSINTVHTHRKHLMEKIQAHTTADLTRYAIREGLSEL